jgi:two-component system, cell cycle response regulator DivK
MDIQLPCLTGYEATRQINASPNLRETLIIAVSSFAMRGDEVKARAARCDHYVTKPYSPIQLQRIIRGFLPEQAQAATRFMSPLSRRHVNEMNFG